MHDFQEPQNDKLRSACNGVFVLIFFKVMYNKTIFGLGFRKTLNNQDLGKFYQPWPMLV